MAMALWLARMVVGVAVDIEQLTALITVAEGAVSATYRTITMDHRGTGESGNPEAACSTRQFADDVVAVLDHVGVARAGVYGTPVSKDCRQ
ncbi:alpha/beta fold hydrolase [Streptomyces caniferus]|uniref:alpha/beta fold hydrolase n=1 Tax=Streptomyces caniferus TaxID=285557 RepID=UPI0033CC6C86